MAVDKAISEVSPYGVGDIFIVVTSRVQVAFELAVRGLIV